MPLSAIYHPFLLFLLLTAAGGVRGQSVYLSEVTATNTTHYDEDGDLADWLELHNGGPAAVDLTGYSLTDDPATPRQWTFAPLTLAPDEHLLVWASKKDRRQVRYPHTLLRSGDEVRYLVPDSTVDRYAWTAVDYPDNDWIPGPTPIGYGVGGEATLLPPTTQVVFLRYRFHVADTAEVSDLLLDIDYDDGFVAYLNGTEVARAGIWNDRPAYDSRAARNTDAKLPQGRSLPSFSLNDYRELLQEGDNVLAIQVHNQGSGSPDFTINPFLTLYLPQPANAITRPPAVLPHGRRSPHTNFRLAAGGETLYLYDAGGTLVDRLTYGQLPAGSSTGRSPDNRTGTVLFGQPTPGLPNTTPAYADAVDGQVSFSRSGGPTLPFSLVLSGGGPEFVIRYTTDATTPTDSSTRYTGPLRIDQTTVVRAALFRDDRLPGPVGSQTYLVNATHGLPTLSLVADPDDLFSPKRGIYVLGPGSHGDYPYFDANIWQEWERPVHVAFREAGGGGGTDFGAGVKVFGGFSRALPQRSLALFARSAYGSPRIDYPLFGDRPYEAFESVVLRNSGNDWMQTMLSDAAVATLYRDADLETLGYRPVVTYLNGSYWGLYNIREKVNEHYLASRSGYAPDEINLLELDGSIIHGQRSGYHELIRYVRANDLAQDSAYYRFATEVDVDNFVLYNALQIYLNNTDWPANNHKFWRPDGGRWRWILFDTDVGLGHFSSKDYSNNSLRRALDYPAPGWRYQTHAATLLRAAVQQPGFRHQFVNRLADEMNSRLQPDHIHQLVDSLAAIIAPELPRHFARYNRDFAGWQPRLDRIKDYASRRPAAMKQHLLEVFALPAFHTLHLTNPEPAAGYVQLNSLTLTAADWRGDYFEDVPVHLTAVARPGYAFAYWTGDVYSTDPALTVNPNAALRIVPVFVPTQPIPAQAVINEVHYASDPEANSGDWVELYNPGSQPLDLSGWTVSDSDDSHRFTFPAGSVLTSGGYLTVVQDRIRYGMVHSTERDVVGDLGFGLSAQGDGVRLYDVDGQLHDEVTYTAAAPWPTAFEGEGRTIALTDPATDNRQGQHWAADLTGTPRNPNRRRPVPAFAGPPNTAELAVRPNPTPDHASVRVHLTSATPALLNLYDATGRHLATLHQGPLPGGTTFLPIDLSAYPLGTYLLRLTSSDDLPPVSLRLIHH